MALQAPHIHTLAISLAFLSDKFTGASMQDVVGTEGFQVLPGGLILNWGSVSHGANTVITSTLSKAYPTTHIATIASYKDVDINNGASCGSAPLSLTQLRTSNGDGVPNTVSWFSIGI